MPNGQQEEAIAFGREYVSEFLHIAVPTMIATTYLRPTGIGLLACPPQVSGQTSSLPAVAGACSGKCSASNSTNSMHSQWWRTTDMAKLRRFSPRDSM